MRVLEATNIVDHYCGYIVRIISEINELKKRGFHVELVAFCNLKDFILNQNKIARFKNLFSDLDIPIYIRLTFPAKLSPLLNIFKGIFDAITLNQIKTFRRIDLIHCHDRFVFFRFKKIVGAPLVFDMHGAVEELFISQENKTDLNRKHYYESLEKKIIEQGDGIVSVSSTLQGHWHTKYGTTNVNEAIVPCAVDTQLFKFDPLVRIGKRQTLGCKADIPIFTYLGSLRYYQRFDRILDIFSRINLIVQDSLFLILVPNTDLNKIYEYLQPLDPCLKNKIKVFSATHDEIPPYLMASDFGFLIRDDVLINRVASPTKLSEYLALGLHVIASPYVDQVREILNQSSLGYIVDGVSDLDGIDSYVKNIMKNRDQEGNKCINYAIDNLSWSVVGEKLENLYLRILE